jgi:hypothetical protein
MKRDKRIVFVADLHSGHEYGLTFPFWWSEPSSKQGKFQRELHKFYTKSVESLRPIDVLSVDGDCIEGKGERSGGMELISSDRHEQIKMAKEAIDYVDAPITRITYGTRYHTGRDEDFEAMLKMICKGKVSIHGHDFFNVNGVNFDVKHKVGSSSIPHGRITAIARARMWNVMWNAEHERQPKADVLIRAHAHYYGGGFGPDWLGINLPALTYNSAYGIRECEGIVNVGLVVFDVTEKGNYAWHPILASFPELKVKSEVI